jgi:hypothetical protein
MMVFSVWFMLKCYKQSQLSSREFSWVKWHEVAGGLVGEFCCWLEVSLWGRLVWNGRHPGTQLVKLSVDKAFCTGGCDKKTWVWEAEESSSVEAIAMKRLVETVIDCGHKSVCQWTVKCSSKWCIQVVSKSIHQIHTLSIVTHPHIVTKCSGYCQGQSHMQI